MTAPFRFSAVPRLMPLILATPLAVSGTCTLAAPPPLLVAWLLLWRGTTVGNTPRAIVGRILAFTKRTGFAITVLSIEIFTPSASRLPDLRPGLPRDLPSAGQWGDAERPVQARRYQ